jgi:hypothetical protein
VRFADFARGAGYPHVFEFDDLATFAAEIGKVLALRGPVFATLKLVAANAEEVDFSKLNSADARRQFKEAIRPFLEAGRTTPVA